MLNNKRLSRWLAFFTLAATFALALPAQANTWPLPQPGSRLVGQHAVHVVEDNGGSLEAIAKKYNVKTGEAIWQAKQKCPDLVTVPPHFDLYKRFSKMARRIYSEYTDKIEPFGLDEAWLDVTDNKNMNGKEIALEINRRIKQELGITVSIGVSFNKIFAKFGSDYKKPDAITEITRENYRDIVWNCPAKDLLYVGRATGRKLESIGIYTIGDIATAEVTLLR